MNRILKYTAAAAMSGALALAVTTTPSQARWGHGGAAAAGFAAGAFIGAAAASSAYNDGYYYGDSYAYDPGPSYAYTDDYAYAPGPSYGYGYRPWSGSSCGRSPGSMNYTSCN